MSVPRYLHFKLLPVEQLHYYDTLTVLQRLSTAAMGTHCQTVIHQQPFFSLMNKKQTIMKLLPGYIWM